VAAEADPNTKLLRLVLVAVLCAALLVAGIFAFRATASYVYWNDERHQFQPIAGWMTPRYVAKSWQVRPEVVAGALQFELADGTAHQSLIQLASVRGESLSSVIETLEAAIAADKAAGE